MAGAFLELKKRETVQTNLRNNEPYHTMNDPIITYRGATARLSELQRVDQLQQQQGSRLIQYRGISAETDLNAPTEKKMTTVTYRGATTQMEL